MSETNDEAKAKAAAEAKAAADAKPVADAEAKAAADAKPVAEAKAKAAAEAKAAADAKPVEPEPVDAIATAEDDDAQLPVEVDDDGWPLETAEAKLGDPSALPFGSAASLGEAKLGAPAPPVELPPPGRPSGQLVAQQPTGAQLPSPAAAAYEAARIVGEMVGDIESVSGAALVAAAAAGAAIEAARARAAAGELEPPPPPPDPATDDPKITARHQRELILRALADDIAANATAETAAANASNTALPATDPRAASGIRDRPSGIRDRPSGIRDRPSGIRDRPSGIRDRPTIAANPAVRMEPLRVTGRMDALRVTGQMRVQVPGEELLPDDVEEDVDPVAIAAAAIARLRERARSDFAELRVQYRRHDILVVFAALVIIAIAGRVHQALVTPPTTPFDKAASHGLSFDHARGWLKTVGGPLPSPRLAQDVAPGSGKPSDSLYHVELTSPVDPTARIEVVIDKKPAWSNIVTGLDLDRRTRWGELYVLDDSSVRSVEDHQWLRTAYRFAHAIDKGDAPRVDHAIEYATIDREQSYVVTLFGAPAELERIEDVVAPTLRVATQTGLPLVPQTGHLSTRNYPNAVARAFASTVMVVVADVIDGRLHARGGGSGVIVGKDGSILTNYHVIHDQRGRLHDVFVIGRFSEQDKAPQLFCAGKPSRSKLQRELDLALLKCDLDLDGRAWNPAASPAAWPTLAEAKLSELKMGQRIWVLGYPDVGGGGLTLGAGEALGWSGIDGAAGKDFLKTDAAIRHGNSGGPVINDAGQLIGIASAVRAKQNAAGEIVEVVQAGGRVRPIATASDLLAIAAAGWTPREGRTDVELQPSAIEAPAEGIQIQSHVLDAANESPVRDALVMVLRPGVNAATVDVNRLDDQVLAYGRSNAQGEVLLKQPVPVPGTYSVMVVARGYEPVIAEGELVLAANAPALYDPWGKILLRSR